MKTVRIKINLPANVYYGIKRLVKLNNSQMAEFCSALCINRMIDKGYLDEFGNPIEMIHLEIPHLDFSSIDTNLNISTNDLREYTVNCSSFNHDIKQK